MTNWLQTEKLIIQIWSCYYEWQNIALIIVALQSLILIIISFLGYSLLKQLKWPLCWLFDVIIGNYIDDANMYLILTSWYLTESRFEDWRSESSSFSIEHNDSSCDGLLNKRKVKSSASDISDGSVKKLASSCNVLDPQGPLLQKWNKIFVITCVTAISVDPLFFYIPVIDDKSKCLGLDRTLKITASVLRTFFDLFYILRIIFKFRTGFIAPSSRVFGRGELVDDRCAIVMRYLSSYFIIDILSIIPLPQVSSSSLLIPKSKLIVLFFFFFFIFI